MISRASRGLFWLVLGPVLVIGTSVRAEEVLPPKLPTEIDQAWREGREAALSGQQASAFAAFERMGRLREEQGLAQIEIVSAALVVEGRKALRTHRPTVAGLLAQGASLASPRYPPAHFLRAEIAWSADPPRPIEGALGYAAGWGESFLDPWVIIHLGGRAAWILYAALWAACFLLLFLEVPRHFDRITHNLMELTAGWIWKPAIALLAAALLFVPVLLGLPVGWEPVWILAAVWTFSVRETRRILALIPFLIVSIPVVLPFLMGWVRLDQTPRTQLLASHLRNDFPSRSTPELVRMIEETPKGWVVPFAAASAMSELGAYSDSESAYRLVLSRGGPEARTHVNLGVSEYYQGHPDRAMEEFRRAIARNPRQADARYNLSLLLRESLRFAEAEAVSREAPRTQAPDEFSRLARRGERAVQRPMAESRLTPLEAWGPILTGAGSPTGARPLGRWSEGWLASDEVFRSLIGLPLSFAPVIGGVLAVLLIGVGRWSFSFWGGSRCDDCGRPTCPRCQRYLLKRRICPACWRAQTAKRERGEAATPAVGYGPSPHVAVILSILPGMGQVYLGRPRAAFFAFFTLVLLLGVGFGAGVLAPYPEAISGTGLLPGILLPAIAGAALYATTFLHVRRVLEALHGA